jgi:hypothetical protein
LGWDQGSSRKISTPENARVEEVHLPRKDLNVTTKKTSPRDNNLQTIKITRRTKIAQFKEVFQRNPNRREEIFL